MVGDASSFYDIVENESNVLQTATPFQFVKVTNNYRWVDSERTLELEDDDSWFSDDGGRVYLITKPNWAVRIRIETNINGYFRPLTSSDYSSWRTHYDAEVKAPLLSPFSEDDSSLEITMRGKSALAIAMTGDDGSWDKEGSYFDQYMIVSHGMADTRDDMDGDAPLDGWGFALSLTGKYGNWASRESNLTLLKAPSPPSAWLGSKVGSQWVRITIVNATRQNESIGGIQGDLEEVTGDDDPTFIPSGVWRDYDLETGYDNNGAKWEVSLKQRTGEGTSDEMSLGTEWGVFVDGTLERIFGEWQFNTALEYYQGRVEQREQQGLDEDSNSTDWVKWAIFGVVGVVVVGVILKVRG